MLVKNTLLICAALLAWYSISPSYAGDIISCDSFESCPALPTDEIAALDARIKALEALLAGATRGIDSSTSQDTLTFNNSVSSEAAAVRDLSTTDKEADLLVCFNGAGELLPCANDVEPPPPVDPYIGSWTGRMVYDRRISNTCYDADVHMTVISATLTYDDITSTTVIRDSGGLDTDPNDKRINLESGEATGKFYVFYSDARTYIVFTLQFDTQGSAQGLWNYENGDCYGDLNFTKD